MSTWTNILDLVYPVGSIYQSVNSSSPASLFGGTWTKYADNSVLSARKGSVTIDKNLNVSFCQGNYSLNCWDIVTQGAVVVTESEVDSYIGKDSTNNLLTGWVGSLNGDSYSRSSVGSLISYNPNQKKVYEENLTVNSTSKYRLKLFAVKPSTQTTMYIKPVYIWKRTA